MEWFEKLGFYENPFEINLFGTDFGLAGLKKQKEDILYRVSAGSMVLVEGLPGSGKTGLLKHVIDNFKGDGRVIYVDGAKLNKALDIESLLINRYGWKGRLLKKKPKNMILLLDNVNSISRKNAEKIKFYYDQDYLRSVVFSTHDYSSVEFDDSIRDRIENRIIKLKFPGKKNLVKMLHGRLEDNDAFTDAILKEIVDNSDQNPTSVLLNAQKVGKHIASNGKESLNIKEIVKKKSEKKITEDASIFQCANCSDQLVSVGKYWRCNNCDSFCSDCGAIVNDDDSECPECEAEFEEEQ
ncbi:MAG: ATP-binding protein [Nanoarchaeota archaeon]